jgi:FkbM family methyltransferase
MRVQRSYILSEGERPFRHFSGWHRVTAWLSRTFFDNCTYTVRHGLLKGMKRKGGLGFVPELFVRGESAETDFWRRCDLSGLVVYDVGAFQGLLTLFFSRRARHVVAYEPHPANFERLCENLRLNGVENVTVRCLGLGAQPGRARLVWDPLMLGGATCNPLIGRSLGESRCQAEEIRISTLDSEIERHGLPRPDLIKIDVEGFELEVLRGALATLRREHPPLFLEMHGATVRHKQENTAEILEFLAGTGYREILHVESGRMLTAAATELPCEGHLYCR